MGQIGDIFAIFCGYIQDITGMEIPSWGKHPKKKWHDRLETLFPGKPTSTVVLIIFIMVSTLALMPVNWDLGMITILEL